MENLEPRFTTEEVANRYGVKITTVQRWVREGRLTALNLGGNRYGPYVYRPSDLEEFEQPYPKRAPPGPPGSCERGSVYRLHYPLLWLA